MHVPAGVPVKVPDPLEPKVTLPDGVVGVAEVSVTVTVQVEATPTLALLGGQETEVEVACSGEVTGRSNTPKLS